MGCPTAYLLSCALQLDITRDEPTGICKAAATLCCQPAAAAATAAAMGLSGPMPHCARCGTALMLCG